MHYNGDEETEERSLFDTDFSSVKRGDSWLDIHRSGDIGLNKLCTVLVQLEVGDLLVMGVA